MRETPPSAAILPAAWLCPLLAGLAMAGCMSENDAYTGQETPPATPVANANTNAPITAPALPIRAQGICPPGPYAAVPLPPGAAAHELPLSGPGAAAYAHLDGPVWLANRQVLTLSAWPQVNGTGSGPISVLLQVSAQGAASIGAVAGIYGSNGLAVDAQGQLWAALHDRQEVGTIQPTQGTRVAAASTYGGRPFNSPNDLSLRRDGNLYFTDPSYQAEGRAGQPVTGIYRVSPLGEVQLVDASRDQPNGIALSLDETILYVGGNDQRIVAYPVGKDGSVGQGRLFVEAGDNIDGMVVDCAGNVYAVLYTKQMVQVWSQAGTPMGGLSLPEPATNLAFGGADRQTLYITTLTRLFAIGGQVPGLPY